MNSNKVQLDVKHHVAIMCFCGSINITLRIYCRDMAYNEDRYQDILRKQTQ